MSIIWTLSEHYMNIIQTVSEHSTNIIWTVCKLFLIDCCLSVGDWLLPYCRFTDLFVEASSVVLSCCRFFSDLLTHKYYILFESELLSIAAVLCDLWPLTSCVWPQRSLNGIVSFSISFIFWWIESTAVGFCSWCLFILYLIDWINNTSQFNQWSYWHI